MNTPPEEMRFGANYPDAKLQKLITEAMSAIQAEQLGEQDTNRMCRLLDAEEYLRQAWNAIERMN